ncbi:Oocyte zinc finger protein XlCOF7.1 [Eumeta japonica]|uniref:Oocyte zinc finger protein XlCOF7.1 n=1 Tax=Eumeta variegata TaxID=151549 RepID=A0A4C1WMX3_EUMVA|nr:Oocyte zinc finger protein XlCOF7.1 [Eumeta japonica]
MDYPEHFAQSEPNLKREIPNATIDSQTIAELYGCVRPLSLLYSDTSADGVEERSLVRSAEAERDNESCFFVVRSELEKFKDHLPSLYKQIIHNAKHIIIPLIKHELHQCLECFFYFTSHNELTLHEDLKHPKKKTKFTNRFVFEDDIISGDEDENRDEEKSILNCFMNECKVKLDHGNLESTQKNENNVDLIKKDTNVLNGFCDPIDNGKYECTDYSVLIKPGFFRCKFCGKAFTNRYELICHNIVHMKIKKCKTNLCCYCDRFYASRASLENHVETIHNTKRVIHIHSHKCTKCGATYHNLKRHFEVHHKHTCYKCRKDFDDEQDLVVHCIEHYETVTCQLCNDNVAKLHLDNHMKKHNVLMRVCDFCEMYSKNLSMYSYRHIQKIDASTGYSKCDQCSLNFSSLNLVEKVWKLNGNMVNMVKSKKGRGNKRVVTNEMRLKNIQNRMKILNKIRKF